MNENVIFVYYLAGVIIGCSYAISTLLNPVILEYFPVSCKMFFERFCKNCRCTCINYFVDILPKLPYALPIQIVKYSNVNSKMKRTQYIYI